MTTFAFTWCDDAVKRRCLIFESGDPVSTSHLKWYFALAYRRWIVTTICSRKSET